MFGNTSPTGKRLIGGTVTARQAGQQFGSMTLPGGERTRDLGGIMEAKHRSASKKPERQPQHEVKIVWWKRPITWIAGFVSVLGLAIATALGTGIGNSILTEAKGHLTSTTSPVAIDEVSHIQTYQDYSFVSPRRLVLTQQQLSIMNNQITSSPSAYSNWFLSHDGVITNQGIIGITVHGNASGPVTITDMQVVKHCGRPLAGGTLFYSPSSGAGPFSTDQIGFDLGQQVAIGQYLPAPGPQEQSSGGNFFAKKVITLKPGEPQTLSAFITAENEYCSFTFQLHVVSPSGHPVTETITDNGEPFQITTDGREGLMGTANDVPFSSYRVVYAGGSADTENRGSFVQVNPLTYRGAGNPNSFPPPAQAGAGIASQGPMVFLPCCGIPGPKQNPQANRAEDYRPRTVSFDATGSHMLQNATWQVWNATQAIAVGTAAINSCEPACAGGRYYKDPVIVTLTEPQKCNGSWFWSKVVWHFPGSVPPGETQNQTSSILFGC